MYLRTRIQRLEQFARFHPLQLGFLAGIYLTIFLLYDYILHLPQPLSFDHGDIWQVQLILKNSLQAYTKFDFYQLLHPPFFYGFENRVFFADFHLFLAVLLLPGFLITQNIEVLFKLLAVTTLILSFFAMYLLSFYFTKNTLASIISGMIFTFNPFVMGRFPDHILPYSLIYLPLIFLYLEKSFQKPTNKNLFLLMIFLSLQLIASSLYYGAFLFIILPVYLFIRAIQLRYKIKFLVNKGSFFGLAIFSLLLIMLTFFYHSTYAKNPNLRGMDRSELYSATPADLFKFNEQNYIYSVLGLTHKKTIPNQLNYEADREKHLAIGITTLFIFILSFFLVSKSEFSKLYLTSLILVVLGYILSFGPKIFFSPDLSIPNFVYQFVYFVDPLLSHIRVPARFAIFSFLFISLISALTLSVLSSKVSKSAFRYFCGVFIFLLILEYWQMPFSYAKIDQNTKEGYKYLETNPEIKVLLELPIGNEINRTSYKDSKYLFFATHYHSKQLINGYSGSIPLAYYQKIDPLNYNFPTHAKINLLRSWGVNAINLHKSEFTYKEDFTLMKDKLLKLNQKLLYENDEIAIFQI